MPTYEYKCNVCGKIFEKYQNINDPALTRCIFCDGDVERLIGTGGGFILKGSGFYANDYSSSKENITRCGRETPCCGRDSFCGKPECQK